MVVITIEQDHILHELDKLKEKYEGIKEDAEDAKDKYRFAVASGFVLAIIECQNLINKEKKLFSKKGG